jgi:DNA-binding PadR family transcriptional regulator
MLSRTMMSILGIIKIKPINAYEITKKFSAMNENKQCKIPSSTVYAVVRESSKKRYITVKAEKDGEMPAKKIYSITETGMVELKKTVEKFICEFDYDIRGFNIAIYLSDTLEKSKLKELLKIRMKIIEAVLTEIKIQINKMISENQDELIIENTRQKLYIIEAHLKGSTSLYNLLKF